MAAGAPAFPALESAGGIVLPATLATLAFVLLGPVGEVVGAVVTLVGVVALSAIIAIVMSISGIDFRRGKHVFGLLKSQVFAPLGKYAHASLSAESRERVVDAAAWAFSAQAQARLYFHAATEARWDPAGRAWQPIRVTSRVAVHLIAAKDPAHLRALACFWRHAPEKMAADLEDLIAACHMSQRDIVVSGVVVSAAGPPRAWTARIEVTRAAAATLEHTVDGVLCVHPRAPLPLGSAAADDVLAPLLRRRPCAGLACAASDASDASATSATSVTSAASATSATSGASDANDKSGTPATT